MSCVTSLLPSTTCGRAVAAGDYSDSWRINDGLILHDGCVFVSSTSAILPDALQLAHTAGHEGVQKMLQRLRADFFLEHDRRTVRDYVRSCATCQWNKTEAPYPTGLLQPLPVPSRVWSDNIHGLCRGAPQGTRQECHTHCG
jgi:hypothetical protein